MLSPVSGLSVNSLQVLACFFLLLFFAEVIQGADSIFGIRLSSLESCSKGQTNHSWVHSPSETGVTPRHHRCKIMEIMQISSLCISWARYVTKLSLGTESKALLFVRLTPSPVCWGSGGSMELSQPWVPCSWTRILSPRPLAMLAGWGF